MVGFEHLNDGWECCVGVLKIALQPSIAQKTRNGCVFFCTVVFPSSPKRATNQFRESLRKRFP